MFSYFLKKDEVALSDEDKAAAINLAIFLELYMYDKEILFIVSKIFSKGEKEALCKFWQDVSPMTCKACLCLREFEGKY